MNEENNKDIIKTINANNTGWDILPVKTKWAQSYVYMMLPVFALIELICIIVDVTYLAIGKEIVFVNFIINIILFVLTITTIVLLIKFKKMGYFLNIALLICQSVAGVVLMQINPIEGVGSSVFSDFIMLISLWALPNIIYFYFRRGFFIKNISDDRELKFKYELLGKVVLLFKQLSFGICLERINAYDKPNKYLKFYIFYYMPIIILAYCSANYIPKFDMFLNILLFLFSLITYYYLLKLEKIGYYLNIIYLISDLVLFGIYDLFISPVKENNIQNGVIVICICQAI